MRLVDGMLEEDGGRDKKSLPRSLGLFWEQRLGGVFLGGDREVAERSWKVDVSVG